MIVGQLEIQMLANMARLQADMDAAKRSVGGAMDHIEKTVNQAKSALLGLGAGLSVAVFAGWIRGAIDAADETNKLAQKIGVATQDVAGMQLAFRQAGVGDAFASSMAKMSKSVADGSDAFVAMGVATKNADGTLRSTRVLLGEVADKFASYEDGAAKSALAQAIFGKSGAEMIPLLNAGSAALDEYDAMAAKLGLTIGEETAKEAEKFNDTLDLIGQGSQGVARQLAAQLLPTLSGLADQFFTSMSSGDKLKNTADFLASSMKLLYIAGIGVVEVFTTVGKTLGGVGAAAVAAMSGDFSGAVGILKDMKADIGIGWKDTLGQMQAAWTTTGSSAMEAMATTQKAIKGAAPLVDDLTKKVKANAEAEKEAKKAAAEAAKLAAAIAKENTKEVDALYEAQERLRMGNEDQIKTARTMLEQIEFETTLLGMNAQERAQATLVRDLETKGIVKGTQAYEAYIQKLKDATALKGVTEGQMKVAEESANWWKKAGEQIESSLTSALINGFGKGKDLWTSLRDYIVNGAAAMVVRVAVQPVMGALGSMLGMGSAVASTVGGEGAGDSGVGTALTGASLMANMGGAFGAGASWLFGGGSLMGNLTAGASLMGTGTMAGMASGMSMLAGAIGPIAVGVALLSKAMDYTVSAKGNAIVANVGARGLVGQAASRADFEQQGGLFGGGTTQNSTWGVASAGTSNYLNRAVQNVTAANAAYAQVLGLSGTALDGFTKQLDINVTGMDAAAAQAAIDAEVTKFAVEQASSAYGAAVGQFAKEGETMVQTLQRLAAMQVMSTALNELGGVFGRIAHLGVEGRDSMIQLAGGIEALLKKSSDFVKDYYTQAEQSGLSARAVLTQLSAAGIQDAGALQTREQYRALVESMNVSTQTGREQLNALLTLAPQFAQISDAIKTQGGDLGSLALLAPQIAALDPLFQQTNDS
ncbi:MAG: hypothetical protein KA751_10395, partial [Comamonas sp.]|nr:hypothetical protein [Comamonas sp.]